MEVKGSPLRLSGLFKILLQSQKYQTKFWKESPYTSHLEHKQHKSKGGVNHIRDKLKQNDHLLTNYCDLSDPTPQMYIVIMYS